MSEVLEEAIARLRTHPAAEQDEIGHLLLSMIAAPVPLTLTAADREAIRLSREAAERGAFATPEAVAAVLAKAGA